ncbi:uncharacterized protein BCR38DRAFT_347050 [Pseudomassariella vexata]|uniref:Integral membrane bound transporter domain-containing protein n=1 Tax=Pseudomassariella vexata TaxID=1141098 RepID=A0A1Y2DT93_9PEZI|nr:uncharacterized protein BCR38DRAFT_347050 [Pseudomassariella vexata]ORY62492.1 hypothetical protein BCR38DRAFT_347050 [Pseudomassariella vexata]
MPALPSYGVYELRDGFFDAVFYPPAEVDMDELMIHAELTLPYAFRKQHPLSLKTFFPKQWHEIKGVYRRVTTTRAGIKLLKSFLAFFIAYVLCLVPSVRAWLGRYSYIMVISPIINHSGRSFGAQVEGAVFTIVGTATGLGWGAFGLWLSTITTTAQVGFGGILATFLCLYIFFIACLRSYYIRTYQGIICAGISIIYTCLAEVSRSEVSWSKLFAYGIPWVLGQAIALVPCVLIAPDAGARPLAVSLHNAFAVMSDGLVISRPDSLIIRRRLAQTFIDLSQAYRDLVIDFSITFFDPKDVLHLRNLMQGVVRTLLSVKDETRLFKNFTSTTTHVQESSHLEDFVVDIGQKLETQETSQAKEMLQFVAGNLAEPTEALILAMKYSLQSCDAVLMEMCGHRQYLGPSDDVSNDVTGSLVKLRRRIIAFGSVQESVLNSNKLPEAYAEHPEVVKIFAFCRSVHQAALSVETLLVKVNEMQQRQPKYPKFHLPSYPLWKSLHRTNRQVRHDRGGLTAGSYFRSFSDISELIQKIKSKEFQPLPRKYENQDEKHETGYATMTAAELEDDEPGTKKARFGHSIWNILHRGQGFETRFALKTTAVTSLLAIPAWLSGSTLWWDEYEIWWAVVMAWLIMAPRVGGNIQDLFTRAICAVLGSVWGGLAYTTRDGNPFVTSVFALIFMIPMVYRFTQSTHPRSGLVGCITFTVVSLAEDSADYQTSPVIVAVTRGGAMAVGVIASIVVNWVLWPFVARHDLRKAISAMIFNCSIVYRSIVSKYVYYEEGHAPTKEDIEASEILEGRLREGFVRLRQLLGLTRHEIRLRSPFDPLPYSALIDACERFFEHVVTVRQSSLFYHPHFIRDNTEAAARLLGYRRDAIATMLTNLYVLSGALRADRKVPKYLPNVAAARRELLDQMKALEIELAAGSKFSANMKAGERKWAQIYSYSYNESLTGCVEQLGELEKYTKVIVGGQG